MRIFYSFFLVIIFIATQSSAQHNGTGKIQYNVFSFEKQITLPGTPENIFDAVTGDISGWWDHHMSEHPKKLFIEPKPGGGFWEIFDDAGNGVLHARVTYSDRGKKLRFEGPLGLAGKAIQMVTTYEFQPVGNDSTLFKVSVHAAGEVEEEIPALVEKVWDHFIFERLKPYVESGDPLK
jgi:uncharacterized protein YndB with AHSA1/START domain